MNRPLVFAVFAVFAVNAVPAADGADVHPEAGTTSAAFLKIGVGARPVGMGEAFSAVPGDLNGLLWNPASLAELPSQTLTGTHNESFQSLRNDFLAYGRPLGITPSGDMRALAFHALTLVPPKQDRRSGAGETDPFNPITTPQGTFGAYDVALGLSAARTLGPWWSVGWTFQLVRQTIDGDAGHTVASNFGLQRRTEIPGLTLGAALLNFGPGVSFDSSFKLPLTLRAGAAYEARWPITLAADVSKPIDDFATVSGGVEVRPVRALTLRGGYRYRLHGNPLGGGSGLRLGAAVRIKEASLEYAFAPFGALGKSHRISLTLPWGEPVRRAPRGELAQLGAMPAASEPALPLPIPAATAKASPGKGFLVASKLRGITSLGMIFEVRAVNADREAVVEEAQFRLILPRPEAIGVEASESNDPVPAEVLSSTWTSYRRLELGRSPLAPIRAAALRFRVERAWLDALPAPAERVTLFKIAQGKAAAVPTRFEGDEGGRAVFAATSDDLDGFWVVAAPTPEKEAASGAPAAPAPAGGAFSIRATPRAEVSGGMIYQISASNRSIGTTFESAEFRVTLQGPAESFQVEARESTDGQAPSGWTVYRSVEIAPTPKIELRSAALKFTVERSWIASAGSAPAQAALFKVENGGMTPQSIRFAGERGSRAVFEAEVSDLAGRWIVAFPNPAAAPAPSTP